MCIKNMAVSSLDSLVDVVFCISELGHFRLSCRNCEDFRFYSSMHALFCYMLAGSHQREAAFVVFDRLHDQKSNKQFVPRAFH